MRNCIWMEFLQRNYKNSVVVGSRFLTHWLNSERYYFIYSDWEVRVWCRDFLAGGEIDRDCSLIDLWGEEFGFINIVGGNTSVIRG